MNVKLLRKVKRQILKEPKQFVMEGFFVEAGSDVTPKKIPNCGTAACICGWAISLKNAVTPAEANCQSVNEWTDGEDALQLTREQADRLFAHFDWPERFFLRYRNAKSFKARAEAAADRIEHFIKTDGAE